MFITLRKDNEPPKLCKKKSAAAAVVVAAAPAVLAQAIDTGRYLLLEGPASIIEGEAGHITATVCSAAGKKLYATRFIEIYVNGELINKMPLTDFLPPVDSIFDDLEPSSL